MEDLSISNKNTLNIVIEVKIIINLGFLKYVNNILNIKLLEIIWN